MTHSTLKAISFSFSFMLLAGCASTMYWVQPGKSNQETAADLHACRTSVQPMGGNQVFSAVDLERSCMGSKGYVLSNKPN